MESIESVAKSQKTWAAHAGATVFAWPGAVGQTGHSMRETRDISNTNSAARLHPGISANTRNLTVPIKENSRSLYYPEAHQLFFGVHGSLLGGHGPAQSWHSPWHHAHCLYEGSAGINSSNTTSLGFLRAFLYRSVSEDLAEAALGWVPPREHGVMSSTCLEQQFQRLAARQDLNLLPSCIDPR